MNFQAVLLDYSLIAMQNDFSIIATASEIARDHMHGTFDWASVFNRIEVGPGLIHVERTIWL